MWAVYDLSSKWRALVKRKKKRAEVYKASLDRWQPLASEDDPRVQQLCDSIQSCIDEAVDANSMEVLASCSQPLKCTMKVAIAENCNTLVQALKHAGALL